MMILNDERIQDHLLHHKCSVTFMVCSRIIMTLYTTSMMQVSTLMVTSYNNISLLSPRTIIIIIMDQLIYTLNFPSNVQPLKTCTIVLAIIVLPQKTTATKTQIWCRKII